MGFLNWERLGNGTYLYTYRLWYRDKRKNLLFIGANNMG